MSEPLRFWGQIHHAAEHTVYRIYFLGDAFAFIRSGRNEMLRLGGASGLLQTAISAGVHTIMKSGPAVRSEAAYGPIDGLPLENLLAEHKRNFLAPVRDISDVSVKLPLFPSLGWTDLHYVFWKLRVRDRGRLKVWVGGENMKLAMPVLTHLFGDVVAGKWMWDTEAAEFRQRSS